MNLAPAVQVAQILGPSVLACSAVIGLMHLRDLKRQRHEVAALELVNSFRNVEFNRALRLVWALPDGASADAVHGGGRELEDAAVLIGTTVEAVGVMVYRRVAPIEIVDELMGDAIVRFWSKLGPWVLELRREQQRESVFEWFQWLVERLGERERRTTQGAHVKFKSWRA